jgi:hypothetical protein
MNKIKTTQHTPGPWSHQPSQYEPEAFDIIQPGIGALAIVKSEHFARLIAAAPELLEVLQTMPHPEYRTGITNLTNEWHEWDAKRSAAIAKATGKT